MKSGWMLVCGCLLFGCSDPATDNIEGNAAGECSDAADNDLDGLFDCNDPDCAGSPGCDEADTDTDTDTDPGPILVPDFGLIDVNPTSNTGGTEVSPRDYLQKVSGWYFTHST